MVNKNELKEILKEASELVKDIPEPVRGKAFEIAVAQFLGTSTKGKPARDSDESVGTGGVEKQTISKLGFFEKMSKELEIDSQLLKTVYKLGKKDDLKVVARLSGNNAENQRRLAFLFLLAKKVGFDGEWVSASDFANQAKSHGIDDGHISENLSKERTILQSGRKRGKEYGLSPAGEARATEILREIVGGRR